MNLLQVTNWHRFGGGLDNVVIATTHLLTQRGHKVLLVSRDSKQLGKGLSGKIRAFACGIYSPSGRHDMARLIQEYKPDLIHVYEVYPFFSPWILVECRRAGIPVVMSCHDYRLTCPTAMHFCDGRICERCLRGREYWCLFRNCRGNIFESLAHALRSTFARKLRLFHENVSLFIILSEFARTRLIESGLPANRIVVLPNMAALDHQGLIPDGRGYAAFAGRMSKEKGIDMLIAAARQLPELEIRLAGDGPLIPNIIREAPPNMKFLGRIESEGMKTFYQNARFLVLPSKCFEMCPLVILEAMAYGLPIIAPSIGGLLELVEDGVTGLLFEPANSDDLAKKMKFLWENPGIGLRMGQAGREKAIREYSEDAYYNRLLAAYEKAIELSKNENNKGINPPN